MHTHERAHTRVLTGEEDGCWVDQFGGGRDVAFFQGTECFASYILHVHHNCPVPGRDMALVQGDAGEEGAPWGSAVPPEDLSGME